MITLWYSLRLHPSLASLALSSPELRSLSDRVAEGPSVLPALEPLHRFALYLADPLSRNPQLVCELGQRGRLETYQPIPAHQDVAYPLGQTLYGLLEVLSLHLADHLARGVRYPLVLDELAQLRRGGVVASHRLIEARDIRHRLHCGPDLLNRPTEPASELLLARFPLELGRELVIGARNLPYLIGHVYGDPYRPAFVRYCSLNRLPHPPRSVRREPKALIGVELLYGLHKSYVALLDEVLEGEPVAAVPLSHRDHQPQVLLDKLAAGLLLAPLGTLGEVYLLLMGEEVALPDMPQVLRQKLRRLRTSNRDVVVSVSCHFCLLYDCIVPLALSQVVFSPHQGVCNAMRPTGSRKASASSSPALPPRERLSDPTEPSHDRHGPAPSTGMILVDQKYDLSWECREKGCLAYGPRADKAGSPREESLGV